MSESKKTLHMGKYFPYNEQSILDNVNDEDIGNYALGSTNGETFFVSHDLSSKQKFIEHNLIKNL